MDKVNYIIEELKKNVDALTNSKSPKFIFVGGIPGAGKSLLIEKAKLNFSTEDFSIIEPDLYRKYFKSAKTVEETVQQTNQIELEILLYSLLKRKNIIHISSLRAFEYINKLIEEQILPLRYDIYLYIIINNKIDSSLSTYERYIIDKQNFDSFPRLNKFEYLEQANNGFDLAIQYFENKKYFKKIHIFKRGKNMELPIEIYSGITDFVNIIYMEKQKQIDELDLNQINLRVNLIRTKLLLNQEKEEFEKVVSKMIYNNLGVNCKEKLRRYNSATDNK